MHQHEGIVVVAYLFGQPLSQVQADLALHGYEEFTTPVIHEDGNEGVAAKVNLVWDAEALADDLADARISCVILDPHNSGGWRIKE